MHEGLDNDDIYIMVEDEFYAVAKQFTQHLHHAEYIRLKNLAKSRNESTITTISRPTDSITAMREETKRRKEHQAKAAKQKSALEQLKARAGAKRPQTGSDEESDEGVVREDDPWAGTTLQGLMTSPSSSRKQTSLTGLQGVLSSTRAAAGFSKPQAQSLGHNALADIAAEKAAVGAATSRNHPAEALEAEDDAPATDDDDDLEAPVTQVRRTARTLYATATANPGFASTKAGKRFIPSPPRPPPPRKTLTHSTHSSSKIRPTHQPKRAVPASDILDSFTLPRSDVSARMMKRRAETNARREKENETKPRLDEIPIFLV